MKGALTNDSLRVSLSQIIFTCHSDPKQITHSGVYLQRTVTSYLDNTSDLSVTTNNILTCDIDHLLPTRVRINLCGIHFPIRIER
ncbi:hypothetical protein GVX82_03500 [Patescibacteria group bacterium]|nr:hypothetical protein [Patescibacteria group bacterium]